MHINIHFDTPSLFMGAGPHAVADRYRSQKSFR